MMGGGIRLFPVALEERSMQTPNHILTSLSARFPIFLAQKTRNPNWLAF